MREILKRLKEVFDTLLGTKAYSDEARTLYKAGSERVAEIQKLFDKGVLAMREGNHARNYEIENKRGSDSNKSALVNQYRRAKENTDILALIKNVESGNFKVNEKVILGAVSTKLAEEIKKLTGINVNNFKIAIEARQIDHILKDHGEKGKTDKSMSNPSDIAKMEYAIHNYDSLIPAGKTQAYTHMVNGRNRTADTVLYEKDIGDKSYYVVQAVPDTKAKTLFIVTAFIGKKGYKKEASQLINAKNLDVTAKTGSANTSNGIVSHPKEVVNRNGENISEEMKQERKGTEYFDAVKRGDMETAQRMVDEAAREAGYKDHLYHGTNAVFTKFDLRKHGGKNGKGEGYGIYLAANREISAPYGDNVIDAYVKFNRLAEGRKKTFSYNEVKNLIKTSCEIDAKRAVEDGEYDSVSEAIRDTWVSNYVYTWRT